MTFPQAIADALPPDGAVVVGKVLSGNPLTIDISTAQVPAGRLFNSGLQPADNVAVIRQDSTWLALGKIIGGTAGGLGLTQLLSAEASGALGLTAVDQAIPGLSISFNTTSSSAILLAIWTTEFITVAANTSTSNSQLYVDGVAMTNQSATFRADATGQRATIATASLNVITTPGGHTVAVEARTSGGAGLVNANNSNSNLVIGVFE